MATMDDKKIIETILRNGGTYPGDPQCLAVYQFINAYGKTAWAVYWPGMNPDLPPTEYVIQPVLLWSKAGGYTPDGELFLSGVA